MTTKNIERDQLKQQQQQEKNSTTNDSIFNKNNDSLISLQQQQSNLDENHNNIIIIDSNFNKKKQQLKQKNLKINQQSPNNNDDLMEPEQRQQQQQRKNRSSRSRSRSSSIVSNRSSNASSESNYYLRSQCTNDCCIVAQQQLQQQLLIGAAGGEGSQSNNNSENHHQQQFHNHHHHHHNHKESGRRKRKLIAKEDLNSTLTSTNDKQNIKKSKVIETTTTITTTTTESTTTEDEKTRIDKNQLVSKKTNLIFTTKNSQSLLVDSNNRQSLIKPKPSSTAASIEQNTIINDNNNENNNEKITFLENKKHHSSTNTAFIQQHSNSSSSNSATSHQTQKLVAEANAAIATTTEQALPIVVSSSLSSTKNNNNTNLSSFISEKGDLNHKLLSKKSKQQKEKQQTTKNSVSIQISTQKKKTSSSTTSKSSSSSEKNKSPIKKGQASSTQNKQQQQQETRSIDEEIRYRYQQYLEWETNFKDSNKTDYTYAHSFSYSPLVSPAEQFNWTVPNMSRPSVRHRGINNNNQVSNEEYSSTSMRYLQNHPPMTTRSQTSSLSTHRTDTHFISRNDIEPYHSTPKQKQKQTKNQKIGSEFSDDDDELNNTVVISPHIAKNNKKTFLTNKYLNAGGDYNSENFDYSEDDEEQLTFIRRVKRYITTTIRNTFIINNHDDENIGSNFNGDAVPLASSSNNHREKYQISSCTTNNQYLQQRRNLKNNNNNENNKEINSSSWYWFGTNNNLNNDHNNYNNNDENNEIIDNNLNRKVFWRRWPFWLFLFLLLLLLTLLLGYLLGWSSFNSSSSYYKFLHLSDEPKIIDSSTSYASYLASLTSSVFVWPKFLSTESLLSVFPSTKSSSSSFNHQELSHLTAEIFALREELIALKNNQNSVRESPPPPSPPMAPLPEIDGLFTKITELESRIITCCKATIPEDIETRVHLALNSKISDLQQQYNAQLKLEIENVKSHLIHYFDKHYSDLNMNFSSIIQQIKLENLQQQQQMMAASTTSTGEDVQKMIEMALAKYDADKTGEADFALESSGAWIMSTRCSESYDQHSASYKLLGLTLWRSSNGPRVVIQSGVVTGECWCFKGSEGRIAIHLSARIIPTAFTYEHIPVELSRDGHIRSAPHQFTVYGLHREDDVDPKILGHYEYKISENGEKQPPLQRFPVQNLDVAKQTFDMIELSVKSNHGHPDYTCLYRFRVHGMLPVVGASTTSTTSDT